MIFSIGILVDDAIVVVENIHRHLQLNRQLPPGSARALSELIPEAVDEVGGPTILATLTVIAALLPMAFVGGLMGPYMAPIPINASHGHADFAGHRVRADALARAPVARPLARIRGLRVPQRASSRCFAACSRRFSTRDRGRRHRRQLWAGVGALILLAVALPGIQWVVLKMLPFDNKSEFQLVVDMPAGTPLEATAAALAQMSRYLATVPEVHDYQVYAGLAAPINFNGLVRQYYLRAGPELGDIQVNLVDRHLRSDQSHVIAERVRPALAAIARQYGAALKVVEVPPGPPVLAPIVAEIYGPDDRGRLALAQSVRAQFQHADDVVDVDASYSASAPRQVVALDRPKASRIGVTDADVLQTLRAGLSGMDVSFLQDGAKYPAPLRLELPDGSHGSLDAALTLGVRAGNGALVPLGSLVQVQDSTVEQPRYHKDLLPVVYVTGDMAGRIDSPLYGMFGMRAALSRLGAPDGGAMREYFVRQPSDPYRGYSHEVGRRVADHL